jgi:folate-dependent phosphoribosylglycinamide formyltransferase PurN
MKPANSKADAVGTAVRLLDRDGIKQTGEDSSQFTANCSLIPERPIRVVVFGGGPVLERGIKRFLCRLEEHRDIELAGVFCQSPAQTFNAVVGDLWRRRRLLALPLLLANAARTIGRYLKGPRREIRLKRQLAKVSDRLHFVPDIHADAVLERVRSLAPDLGLIYGSPILKPKLFEIPRFGTLGIHHGKVPEYRGKKTTFWAMYNGETTAGVTIQKINAGLDTGEVVRAGEVPIGEKSYGAVWRELEDLGFTLYIEAVLDVKRGDATFQAQGMIKGRLYRDPKLRDLLIFWRRQWTK